MIGNYGAGMSTLVAIAAGWQGGAVIVDLGGGTYGIGIGEPADAYLVSLGGGLFAVDSVGPATHRIRVNPDAITIEDF